MTEPEDSAEGQSEWRTGWGVVLAAAIGISIGGIHTHFIGTMINPLEAAYGWSRAEIAFGLTIISFLGPLTNIMAGAAADRFGARRVALGGIAPFGVGFLLMGLAGPAIWTWYAACALFAFLHLALSAVVWTSLVVKRFQRQRGTALAMSLMGGAVMVGVTPSLVVFLLDVAGIRGVFYSIAMIGSILIFIPTFLFFREHEIASPGPIHGVAQAPNQALDGYTVKEALSTPSFWKLAISLLLIASCMGTFMVHIQPMLTDSGLSPAVAASVALFIGPSMIAGRLTTGAFFDRFDARLVSGGAFLLPVVASLLVMNLDGSYVSSAAAGIFIGLGMGAEIDVVAFLTSRYFGLRRYGVLFAILLGVYTLGVGSGSVISGASYDKYGSYDSILLFLAGGCLLATALVATLGRPRDFAEA
jgi:predicted MFS family arabinose efflux permease